MSKRIGIVGGGAAGFFAAIHAARRHPKAHITIYEALKTPLSKVLISGGGRCNVTNHTLDTRELVKHYPRGFRELRGAFSRFAVADTIAFFEEHQVPLKVESDNRMFPTTDCSATIADCLIAISQQVNVLLKTKVKITAIEDHGNVLQLSGPGGIQDTVDTLILTSGGSRQSFGLAEQLGHTIVDPVPSLFTFKITDPLFKDLPGVSFPQAILTLTIGKKKFTNEGPLLITHWGLSGPATIVLSARAARELHDVQYKASLRVNFLPEVERGTIRNVIQGMKDQHGKKHLSTSPPISVPKRFWLQLLSVAGISHNQQYHDCSKTQIQAIEKLLEYHECTIEGKGQFKEEFVTAGGVLLKEVDFKTMQSKVNPRLYLAGEVLNIDGVTGGFNFQSAWTTGWIAGSHCS